ncbi:hypothetical protein ABZ826_22450 [Streptomyces sp. NPDC047515]|uniref:hypothetical protein n=1 Tax=Streptomyces sp. NPDC047515 TaxID=3155380 RepID=UPI0033EE1339
MEKKKLVLPGTLVVAAAVVATLTLWPDAEQAPEPQSVCFGALSKKTAALLDDGEGGKVSANEFERKGKGELAVFRTCHVNRANASGGTRGSLYYLIVEDTRLGLDPPKGSKPLADGHPGWVSPTKAVTQHPDSCPPRCWARRLPISP